MKEFVEGKVTHSVDHEIVYQRIVMSGRGAWTIYWRWYWRHQQGVICSRVTSPCNGVESVNWSSAFTGSLRCLGETLLVPRALTSPHGNGPPTPCCISSKRKIKSSISNTLFQSRGVRRWSAKTHRPRLDSQFLLAGDLQVSCRPTLLLLTIKAAAVLASTIADLCPNRPVLGKLASKR